MVIWITGISGAGKTTLSQALRRRLKPSIPELVVLDGELVREISGTDLGYAEEDRIVQVGRVQRLVKLLVDQGLVVVVALLYSNPSLLALNRRHYPRYFEVHLDAPLWLVKRRDPKGLYERAQKGLERNVVGIDIEWQAPVNPDLVVDASEEAAPDELAARIVAMIPFLEREPAPAPRTAGTR